MPRKNITTGEQNTTPDPHRRSATQLTNISMITAKSKKH